MDSFHNNIIKFLKEAKSGSKEIELVLYSNAEHHELYRCIGKKLLPHVSTAYVYEDIVIDKDIKPISGEEWRSNKWVLKLSELVSKITKDKFKKKKLRHAISPSEMFSTVLNIKFQLIFEIRFHSAYSV